MIKRSDLHMLFADHGQRSRALYLHGPERKNRRIQGFNSDALKFGRSLCAHCNSTLTSPHDKAWQSLVGYLRNDGVLKPGRTVDLSRVFAGSTRSSMLDVHLYIAKLIGCRAVDEQVAIDLDGLGACIKSRAAHPNIHLGFGTLGDEGLGVAGHSNTEGFSGPRGISFMMWIHHIGRVAVRVMYADPEARYKGLIDAYHPRWHQKHLRVARL